MYILYDLRKIILTIFHGFRKMDVGIDISNINVGLAVYN